jgi:NADPH:quinone reductase-like Zn-dependent oxidoreductase
VKAIAFDRYGPPEVLRPMTLTVPEPGPGEVLVKVHATAVHPLDCDIRAKRARVPAKTGFPRVLGFDLSGVVERVGPDVTRFRPGDAVYGLIDYRRDGAAAEFVRTRHDFLQPKPPALGHEEAAAVPLAGLTALQALRLKARLREGERVLVAGAAGAVGHLAVQVARAYGGRVAAQCPAGWEARARELGAEAVFPEGEAPGGERFDVVFDTGGTLPFADARPMLTPTGRYVSVVPHPGPLLAASLGRWVGRRPRCLHVMVLPDPHGLNYLAELIADGRLRPAVAAVYPLDDLVAAHRACEADPGDGPWVVRVT